jgi:hypothetical protein
MSYKSKMKNAHGSVKKAATGIKSPSAAAQITTTSGMSMEGAKRKAYMSRVGSGYRC